MNIFQVNLLLMILYFVIFKFVWRSEKSEIWLNRIVAVQLFVILGFRYQFVGTDTLNYFNNYNIIAEYGFSDIFHNSFLDKGYVLIQWIISRFHVEFQFFLTILAFFCIFVLAFIIEKYSKNVFLSWILFISLGFYGFYFNWIRQALAMTFLLLAFHFLYENKIAISILLWGVATTVHLTAIIFGIIFLLYKVRINVKNIVSIILLSTPIYFFRLNIARIFIDSFKDGRYLNELTGNIGGVGNTFIIICACIIIIAYTNPPWKNKDSLNKLYFCILAVSAVVQMFSAVDFIFTRLNRYFFVFIIICVPFALYNIKGKKITFPEIQWTFFYKMISIFLILICVLYYLPQIDAETANDGILPYYFMWEKS